MPTWLIALIVLIIVFFIFSFFIKRLFLLAFSLAAIYLLFNIGYVWTTSEMSENLKLSKWMDPNSKSDLENAYGIIEGKRDSFKVVNTDKISEEMDLFIKASGEKLSHLDKIVLKDKWNSLFEGLSKEEIIENIKLTKDIWSNVFTEEEMMELIEEE